jgi:2'-hydroxyisoflavone reductase
VNKTRRQVLKASLLGGAAVAAGTAPGVSVSGQSEDAGAGPLSILILGGTGFIGPHMVREALRRGHSVELFNRGRTNNALFPDLKLHKGDRDGGLDALQGGRWDVVIDNSGYVPRHVRDSARLLAPLVRHYLYISTISVYGDFSSPIDEDTALATIDDESIEEVTGETYGPLKALCENRVLTEVGADRTTVLRPTYICGPGDRTDRFTYWPVRTMRGGEMLWPGTPDDRIQIIDVRDLAIFTIDCVERRTAGIYNTVIPAGSLTMGQLAGDCVAVTAASMQPTWVSPAFIAEQEVGLPIWTDPNGEMGNLLRVDGRRAAAAGLQTRPPRETARDTVAWWKTLPADRTAAPRAGLAPDREAELLSLWREQNA